MQPNNNNINVFQLLFPHMRFCGWLFAWLLGGFLLSSLCFCRGIWCLFIYFFRGCCFCLLFFALYLGGINKKKKNYYYLKKQKLQLTGERENNLTHTLHGGLSDSCYATKLYTCSYPWHRRHPWYRGHNPRDTSHPRDLRNTREAWEAWHPWDGSNDTWWRQGGCSDTWWQGGCSAFRYGRVIFLGPVTPARLPFSFPPRGRRLV